MRQKRRPYREYEDDDEDALSDNLAAVNERLDSLTRQLARMAESGAEKRKDDGRLDEITRQLERVAQVGAEKRKDDERLDEITRQLERVAQVNAETLNAADERNADRVADALARIDRRLDQVIHDERAAPAARRAQPVAPPPPFVPPAPAAAPAPPPAAASRGPANWAAQIMARQRALDGSAPTSPPPPAPAPAPMPAATARTPAPPSGWDKAPDLSGVEQQLRQINSQISSLQQPYENGLSALRNELVEVGRALHDAMPRQAIEALEADVRTLAERLDRSRQAGVDDAALGSIEHGLAEIRDALRGLTPAENLAGFEEAVHVLSHKIDQIAAASQGGHDPMAFRQLEQAVSSLRGMVSNVASDGALAQLADEVRGLAGQIERAASESGADALGKLEARIAALMENGRAMPPELEGSIRALSERLDRMQLSQGDQHALVALEDRIAKLSEKLDASDSRLRHLDAIERGLADLLVYLEEMRREGPRGPRAAPLPTPAPEPEPVRPAPAAAPPRSPLDLLDDQPAPLPPAAQLPAVLAAPLPPPALIPAPPHPAAEFRPAPQAIAMPAPAPLPTAAEFRSPQQAKPMPRGRERTPIEPNLPPDTPLEPGSGTPRVKPGSPAARIAASEAALGHAKPAAEHGGKSAAIAAAREAAKAAYLDTPVKVPPGLHGRFGALLKWPFAKRQKAAPDDTAPVLPKLPPEPQRLPPLAPASESVLDAPLPRGQRVLRFIKTLLIAASVAIIVVGAAQTAMELLWPDDSTPSAETPPTPPAAPAAPGRPMPTPQSSLPTPPAPRAEIETPTPRTEAAAPAPRERTSFFDPATVLTPRVAPSEVTGSIARQPAPAATPRLPASPRVEAPATEPPQGGISPNLRTAAAASNPAAEYEIGARYAEGRGVPRNMPEAIVWFERAANAGFVPAQFRLASLNEKGDGIKKDLQAARRLYLQAAGKGHAKAMHNLAVLHAEGIDGKPDYRVAAQWFRKAAGFGVNDSQYNLAILYARGIGVESNLAESYKWFALAAVSGDPDAARKRDEVAARLDRQTLMAAKLAAQTFVPEHEPEDATSLKAPPGGWDRTPASPAKPRKRAPATPAQ